MKRTDPRRDGQIPSVDRRASAHGEPTISLLLEAQQKQQLEQGPSDEMPRVPEALRSGLPRYAGQGLCFRDPECRAASSMVTGHQQPDPRVGRPGRESDPVHFLRERQTSSPRALLMNGRLERNIDW